MILSMAFSIEIEVSNSTPVRNCLIEIMLERAGKRAWRVEKIAALFSGHLD